MKRLEKLKLRGNLDLYVTIVVSIIIAILGAVQIVDITIVSGAILAVLALVSVDLLRTRNEYDRVNQALKAVNESQERLERRVLGLGISATFVPFREGESSRVMRMTRMLVDKAQQEILVLDYNPIEEQESKVRYAIGDKLNTERQEYYDALISKVLSAIEEGASFRYKRIIQIPAGRTLADVVSDDPIFRKHCETMIGLMKKYPDVISLKVCLPIHEGNFIIFDKRQLSLEFIVQEPEKHYYAGGVYFYFDDPTGSLIDEFVKFFERADTISKPASLVDLS